LPPGLSSTAQMIHFYLDEGVFVGPPQSPSRSASIKEISSCNDNSSRRTVAACSCEKQATYSAPTASHSCPVVSLRISSGGTRRFRAPKEIPLSSFNRSTCHSKRFSFFLNFTNLSRRSHLHAVMNLGALLLSVCWWSAHLGNRNAPRKNPRHSTISPSRVLHRETFFTII